MSCRESRFENRQRASLGCRMAVFLTVLSLSRPRRCCRARISPSKAKMARRIVKEAKPKDSIEELLIRDVIDLAWEVLRLRRLKVGILRASMAIGVKIVLDELGHSPLLEFDRNQKLGQRWAAGDKSVRTEVSAALNRAGLTIDDVTAKTAEEKIDTLERLDRMLASAEARRNNALHEIDRHREALGGAARGAIDEIEDAEFREVESGDQNERRS